MNWWLCESFLNTFVYKLLATINMNKPFIHPEILLKIRQGLSLDSTDQLDKGSYENAKSKGEQFANDILKQLFPEKKEYGNIGSHFNTEKLNSIKFTSFREEIVSMHSAMVA